MNHTLAAAQRHIAEIEARVARQSGVVEMLTKAGLDSTQAKRTLYVLTEALALTQEHVRILLRPVSCERLSDAASADLPMTLTG